MRFYPLKDELNVWFVSFDNKEVELNPYDVYDLISYEKLNKIIITPPGCNWRVSPDDDYEYMSNVMGINLQDHEYYIDNELYKTPKWTSFDYLKSILELQDKISWLKQKFQNGESLEEDFHYYTRALSIITEKAREHVNCDM